MTTLREAAQKALEALEDMLGWESLAPQSVQASSKQSLQRLREALAEPEPELVADTESDVLTATYMLGVHAGKKATNRQPLTDEELVDIVGNCAADSGGWFRYHAFARAIERAHGIA